MRLLLPLSVLLLAPFLCTAQHIFKAGFIIKNSADTVKGYIEEGIEDKISETVPFKNDLSQTTPQYLKTSDIIGFGFYNGSQFEKITYTKSLEAGKTTCFAKSLLKGYYRLYAFLNGGRRYFIVKNQQDSVYLLFDDFISPFGSDVEYGNFKGVLGYLATNCARMKSIVERVDYNETDILDFIEQLNNCLAPSASNEVLYVNPKTEFHVYAYAGGLYAGSNYELTGRVMAKFTLPSVDRKISINAGVNFMTLHQNKTYRFYYNGLPSTSEVSSTVSTKLTNFEATMHYYFTNGKFQPYVEVGFCYITGTVNGEFSSTLSPLPTSNVSEATLAGIVGIDYVITRNIMVRADWRYEYVLHYPTIGIALTF